MSQNFSTKFIPQTSTRGMVTDKHVNTFNKLNLHRYYNAIQKLNVPNLFFDYIVDNYKDHQLYQNHIAYIPEYKPLQFTSSFYVRDNDNDCNNPNLIYMVINMQSANEEFHLFTKDHMIDMNIEWLFNENGVDSCKLLLDSEYTEVADDLRAVLEPTIKSVTENTLNLLWANDFKTYIKPNISEF